MKIYLIHVAEAVQATEVTLCGWLRCASWCADMLCIASLCVRFESHTDECAT